MTAESAPPSGASSDHGNPGLGKMIVLGYVLAVLFPIGGFVVGLTQRKRSNHGRTVIRLSIMMQLIYIVLGIAFVGAIK